MQKALGLKHSIEDRIRQYTSPELQQKASNVLEQMYSKLLAQWTAQTLHMAQARKVDTQHIRRPFNQVNSKLKNV